MGFLGSVAKTLGLSGKSGGGTADASKLYAQYGQDINNRISTYLDDINREGANPAIADLLNLTGDINSAVATSNSLLRSKADAIPGLLTDSALGSTATVRRGAVDAARIASGGRGGLAFGGGAGTIAARSAADAGLSQVSAMAQALLQGENIGLSTEQNIIQNTLAGQGLIGQLKTTVAGLNEQKKQRADALRLAHIQSLTGMASGFGVTGLQGNQAAASRRTGLFAGFLGLGG